MKILNIYYYPGGKISHTSMVDMLSRITYKCLKHICYLWQQRINNYIKVYGSQYLLRCKDRENRNMYTIVITS